MEFIDIIYILNSLIFFSILGFIISDIDPDVLFPDLADSWWLFSYLDTASPWQFSFSDPATPTMEGIIYFHNDLMFFIVAISIFVLWMLLRCIFIFKAPVKNEVLSWKNQNGFLGILSKNSRVRILNSSLNENTKKLLNTTQVYVSGVNHNTFIEIAWTVTPAFILMLIVVPSFGLLYSIEEFVEPTLCLKCTGHQWYWCYEFSNIKNPIISEYFEDVKFESYMVPTEDLQIGNLRLLEVTYRVAVPVANHIQVTVTAADVLHSWAVPALGIKIDACPGRLNQASFFIKREGTFFGQCSEICGENHGFMPIVVYARKFQYVLEKLAVEGVLRLVEEDLL